MTTKVPVELLSINGGELVLDADGDTSITADTDDQIDFKVGGTDRLSLASDGKLNVTEIAHITSGNLEIGNGDEKQVFDASDVAIKFQTADTERLRIVGNNLFLNGGTDARIQLGSGGAGANTVSNDTVHIRGDGDDMKLMCANDGQFLFEHNGTERMRISASSGSYAALHYTSDYGRIDFGAVNTGYHHIMAQSGPSKFYFNVRCEASGGFHTYSDENLKQDITTITGALDSVAKMKGVTFKWKDATNRGGGDAGKQFGVTAQNMLEVDAELPSLDIDPLYNVTDKDGATDEDGNFKYVVDGIKEDDKYYTMDYSRLTPFFIEAIKELKTKLEAAEARIATLEGS